MTTAEPEIVDMPEVVAQWTRIRARLQAEVGDVEYRTWLRQMTLAGHEGDEVTVNLPTRFLRDWVSTRYGDRLRVLWQAENPAVRRVDIRVGAVAAETQVAGDVAATPVVTREEPSCGAARTAQGGGIRWAVAG